MKNVLKTASTLLSIAALCVFVQAVPACAAKIADPASPDVAGRIMPAPPMVVGTYDSEGRTNFALFDRGGIATSRPETHITICMDRTRYTYRNIVARKAMTVNIPSEAYAAETDLFGSFSGISGDVYQDKLGVTGMHADKGSAVDAPMIREFPISMECEFVSAETLDAASPYDLLFFKVVKVWIDERYLNERGAVDPKPSEASGILFYNPGRGDHYGYYGLGDYLGKPETLGHEYEAKIPSGTGADSSSSSGCNTGPGLGLLALAVICAAAIRP